MVERKCANCGEEFSAYGNTRYCPDCRDRKNPKGKRLGICKKCGRAFYSWFGAEVCDVCLKAAERERAKKQAAESKRPPQEGHNRQRERCRSCYFGGMTGNYISCDHLLIVGILHLYGAAEDEGRLRGCEGESGEHSCEAYISVEDGEKKYGLTRSYMRVKVFDTCESDNAQRSDGFSYEEGNP